MDITKEVIEEAIRSGGVLLSNYQDKINKAFLEADDDLSVALKFNFKPAGDGVMVRADLNFVAEKVKDHATKLVRPGGGQLELPLRQVAPERSAWTAGGKRRARWYRFR